MRHQTRSPEREPALSAEKTWLHGQNRGTRIMPLSTMTKKKKLWIKGFDRRNYLVAMFCIYPVSRAGWNVNKGVQPVVARSWSRQRQQLLARLSLAEMRKTNWQELR